MPAAACVYLQLFSARARTAGPPLLLAPLTTQPAASAAIRHRRRLGRRPASRTPSGRPAAKRRRRSLICSRMRARWRCWRPILPPPTPCGRSICGRPTSSRRPTTPCREQPHDRGIDYATSASSGPSPEHAAELAQLHAGLFEKRLGRRQLLRFLTHPGSTAFLARVGIAAADRGLHRRPARRRRGGDPHAGRAQGQPAPRHRPQAGGGARPRRQEGRGAAAVPRGRGGQRRGTRRSTRGSASRRSGGARAITSTRAPPPEDALVLALDALRRHEPRCGDPAPHL